MTGTACLDSRVASVYCHGNHTPSLSFDPASAPLGQVRLGSDGAVDPADAASVLAPAAAADSAAAAVVAASGAVQHHVRGARSGRALAARGAIRH
jgi:hypothetical protein